MSYATIIGFLLLAISYMIYSTTNQVFAEMVKDYGFVIGVVSGIGFGFILGGFLGWLFKYRSLAKESKKEVANKDKV